MTHMVPWVGMAAHWIADAAGSGLANMWLPPRGAYCKLTRPTGACCFISVGHFRYSASCLLGGWGGDLGCRDTPLQRVGAGVGGGGGTAGGDRRHGEAMRTELWFILCRVPCLMMSVRNLTRVFVNSRSCFECSYEFVVSL